MRVLSSLVAPAYSATAASSPSAWAQALAQPGFRLRWVLVLGLLGLLVGLGVPPFYTYIQQRPGQLLPDPLLALLPRHDVATPVFLLMYGTAIAATGWLLRHPWLLLRAFWAYFLLSALRMSAIWALPLLPPPGLLPMPDPFTSLFMHTDPYHLVTKDLFFSGHTATVAMLALAVRGRAWRCALGLATGAVGLLVLVQRVHYSYDVLAAPFFAWLAYWGAGLLVPGRRAAASTEVPTT